ERKGFPSFLSASSDKVVLENVGTQMDEKRQQLLLLITASHYKSSMVSRMPQVPPPNDAVGIEDQITKVVQLLDWEDAKPVVAVHLQRFASEQPGMSADVIRKAFLATEEGFLSVVTKAWPTKPQTAAVGSCCLVGVVCSGILYVANLGDSRVVMGKLVKATGEVIAMQLSTEYNARIENIRQELQSLHPDDSHIVVLKHGVWRVKGIIQ
ncbi:hypothetical protein KI387_012518, partial [Taxus chinensis]